MNILIVYAHPEPRSMSGAMKDCAVETLVALGHTVVVSDLYAMQFNPVASRSDMQQPADELYFQLQIEQAAALRENTFSSDISIEQEKVRQSELLIFQFPLWWYSVPAIMKGWIDRVLSYGFAYGGGASLQGRRALLSLTTGGPEHTYQPDMRGTLDLLLKHITDGTFALCGIESLPPFVVYAASRTSHEQRQAALEEYRQRLTAIAGNPP